MRKTLLEESMLGKAVTKMEDGLIDADLGGYVYKKRIALPDRGKKWKSTNAGSREKGERWIFMYGFEKNERDNITKAELAALQGVAKDFLGFSEEVLSQVIACGQLEEVSYEPDNG